MGHAELSPSDGRWPTCHLAIQLDRERPQPDSSGPAAERGTMLHGVAEEILRVIVIDGWGDEEQCSAFIESGLTELNEIDADVVRAYLHKCLTSLVTFNPSVERVGVESEAVIWYDDLELETGTDDFWLFSQGDLIVRDLKCGRIPVYAEGNTQLVAYGWDRVLYLEAQGEVIERISLEISQPSLPNGGFTYWARTRKQLEVEANKLQVAADAINDGSRKAAPSEKTCRWCPHAPCSARTADLKIQLIAKQDVDEMLPDSTLSYLHSKKKEILAWVKLAEQEIRSRIDEFSDWKLVEGRISRDWKNEKEAEDAIELFGVEAIVTTTALLSPAAAEKQVGRGKLDDYITSTPGAPALVPSTDKRPPIKEKIKEMLTK